MSARSLNKVLLIGNLTRDPELRYTPSGTAVCTFGLATNRSWTPNEGGERQEETEYHRIVAWSKLAEICSQLLYKGRKVYVEGRMQTRTWTGQDGQERTTTEVVIDNMIALGAPKGSGVSGEMDYGDYGAPQMPAPAPTAVVDDPSLSSAPMGGQAGQVPADASSFTQPPAEESIVEVEAAPKKSKKTAKASDVADDIPF